MQARSGVNYQALRRLQLAAETGGTSLVLYRPLQASGQASPAPTRLTVTGQGGETLVHLVKRRAALMADTIALNVYPPHWAQRSRHTVHANKTAPINTANAINAANTRPLNPLQPLQPLPRSPETLATAPTPIATIATTATIAVSTHQAHRASSAPR